MQVSNPLNAPSNFSRTPLSAGIVLALASSSLLAQESLQIEEVIVTAQKRSENMQDVPISIEALGNEAIEELNLQNFKDYAEMLPSVAFTPSLGAGSSFSLVYMRGIATAGDGQATTSLPSVGMYLDELSTTTIQGNLDIHMYDVARVEALAGPQGTLYGASSQAGTIRVITNKPELGEFSSNLSVEANTVDEGDSGMLFEGFVNIPMGDKAAVRLVGWHREDAGWIDNVHRTRLLRGNEQTSPTMDIGNGEEPNPVYCNSTVSCPDDDITWDNADKVEEDYNTLETTGARAALRIDLNENWTISPTVMGQTATTEGAWGDDLSDFAGDSDFAVAHFKDEFYDDEWSMVGLTIEGSIGSFDVVYAGSYLERDVEGSFDYTDYSYWYDIAYASNTSGYANFFTDAHFADTGPLAYPNWYVTNAAQVNLDPADVGTRMYTGSYYTNDDHYTKENHELRLSTDPSRRVRGLLGVFWQHQFHDFEQKWTMDDSVANVMELNRGANPEYADVIYLNSMFRNDRDTAYFGSISFDLTEALELTVGTRFFEPEVEVEGFFGFGLGFWEVGFTSGSGEHQCDQFPEGQEDWKGKPCRNVRKGLKESDNVSRVNLSWDVSDDSMLYFTWSEGYRPGGVQRNPSAGEYVSDFLTNIEAGWKTQWMDNRLQFNGAVFNQTWDDIQVSFTGENAITAVNNGPTATVDGLEANLLWLATDKLRISTSMAFYDSKLDDDYCNFTLGVCTKVLAPAGTQLPITAEFKGNMVARYGFTMGSFDAYWQAAVVYEGERRPALPDEDVEVLGMVPSHTTLDIAAGIGKDDWGLDLFVDNATGEDAPLYFQQQCGSAGSCGDQNYGVRVRPMMLGLRFSKDFD